MVSKHLATDSKHAQLKNAILERIASGTIHVGDRLPTQRALMHDYGVSYSTVSRVMADLIREGCLSAKVGRGTFVIRSTPRSETDNDVRAIGLLLCNTVPSDEFYARILHNLQDETWRLAHTLSYMAIDTGRGQDSREKIARLSEETAGFVVTGTFNSGFIRTLCDFGHPITALGFPVDGAGLPTNVDLVTQDARLAGHQAAEYLINQGCRNIALVNGPEEYFFFDEIHRGVEETLGRHGRSMRVHSGCVQMADGRKCAGQLMGKASRPDGLVVASDRVFLGMLSIFLQHQIRIPDDMPVVIIGRPIFDPEMYPPVTRVVWDESASEQSAIRLLLERIDRPERDGEVVTVKSLLTGP